MDRDESERSIVARRFAFRLMKEVNSFVKNGGSLPDAVEGSVLFLANLTRADREEIRRIVEGWSTRRT